MNKGPSGTAKRVRQGEAAAGSRNVRQAVKTKARTPAPASATLPPAPRPRRRSDMEETEAGDKSHTGRSTLEADVRHCLRKVMELTEQFNGLNGKITVLADLPTRMTDTFDTVQREIANLKTATSRRDPRDPPGGSVEPNISNVTVSSAMFTSEVTAKLIKDIAELWTVGMPEESIMETKFLNPPYMIDGVEIPSCLPRAGGRRRRESSSEERATGEDGLAGVGNTA